MTWTLRRYSALKSLGEKKACFNEYQQQRKNEEIAEKRQRLKKAREDFTTMLEETPDLRASTRYSAAQALLEDDPRWKVHTSPLFLKLTVLRMLRAVMMLWGTFVLDQVLTGFPCSAWKRICALSELSIYKGFALTYKLQLR